MSGGGRSDLASSSQRVTRSDSSPRLERNALPSTPIEVAEVEREQALVGLGAEHVDARLQLDAAGAVDQVEQGHLALPPARGQAAGDAVGGVGLLARLQALVGKQDGRDRLDALVDVRERLDALRAQTLELLAPRGEEVVHRQHAAGILPAPLMRGASSAARDHLGRACPPTPTSIFVILSLRLGPRGTGTSTISPRLWPSSALPTGDSLESFMSEGLASAEPTIVYLTDLPDFSSLTCTTEPTRTMSVPRSLEDDDLGGAELLLQPRDPRLEHGLLVLGVVVLRVLHDVAELTRFLDALGDFPALVARKVLELVLELVQAFLGEDDVSGHAGYDLSRGAKGARV